MYAAWHQAAFSRQKRLPNLEKIMTKMGAEVNKQQTPQEMLRMAEMITVALGGKDLRNKKESKGA